MEAKSVYGETCLMNAAYRGHLDICHLLIDKGAQVEAKDLYGYTPLHWAASEGHIEIVRLLCDRGADVEACCNRGRRPLHIAAYYGQISVVKEFIEERNTEINARDDLGCTALREARDGDKHDVAAYLVAHGGLDLGVFDNVAEDDDEEEDEDDDDDDEWEQ